jgi:hypothetical protein
MGQEMYTVLTMIFVNRCTLDFLIRSRHSAGLSLVRSDHGKDMLTLRPPQRIACLDNRHVGTRVPVCVAIYVPRSLGLGTLGDQHLLVDE